MPDLNCEQLRSDGESQTCEFKESLGTSRQDEAIRSLIAFANAEGGGVLFGIRDDRTVVGVDVGQHTLKNLANRIKQRTYPTLPTYITECTLDGANIVRVDAYSDTPPLVGAYLWSDSPIDPHTPVGMDALQCFRRVGRTDQQVNLMHLRSPAPSDPEVVLRPGSGVTRGEGLPSEWHFVYSNNGPGWAYRVEFGAEHPTAALQVGSPGEDLPPPDQENPRYATRPRTRALRAADPGSGEGLNEPVTLYANYWDSQGLRWRSALYLTPAGGERYDVGRRAHLITEFPPKANLVGHSR